MKRRLYFLFPDNAQARTAFADLKSLGVDPAQVHAIARPGMDLSGLPPASDRQRRDMIARIERTLWDSNLILFVVALVALILAVAGGSIVGAVLAAAVMIVSFVSGALFAMRIPATHLDEFREALRHDEVLLMVDVSRDCVDDVEELMHRRHPEAVAGGSGWTLGAFGV